MKKNASLLDNQQSWYDTASLSRTGHYARQSRRKKLTNVEEFVESLPGFKHVRVSNQKPQTRFRYRGQDIIALTWVTTKAFNGHERANYLQLDCSFRCTKPFAYCAPQSIISNEGFPLGFILTPEEAYHTYQWFFEDLVFCAPEGFVIEAKSVLCDEGSALQRFCRLKRFCRRRYRCHRHLIEKFGASIIIGMLVARILRIQSLDIFKRLFQDFHDYADALRAKEQISEKSYKKFKEFLGNDADVFMDGIWHRLAEGIARCSNHAERFHGIVNGMIRRVHRFLRRLTALKDAIIARQMAFSNKQQCRRQMRSVLNGLRSRGEQQTVVCDRPDCTNFTNMMRSRFQLPSFPCEHTVRAWNEDAVPDLEAITESVPKMELQVTELDPDQLDGFKRGFLTAQARKARSKKRRKRTNMKTGEDEYRNEILFEQHDKADEIPKYEFVREIIQGVISIRNRKGAKLPAIDIFHRSHDIIEHFKSVFQAFQASQEARSQPECVDREKEMREWLSSYAADWWVWAANGGVPPSGHPDEKWTPPTDDAPASSQTTSSGQSRHHQTNHDSDQPREEETTVGYIGLENFAHNCYFNAPVLCLFHLRPFHDLFKGLTRPASESFAAVYWELQRQMDNRNVKRSFLEKALNRLRPPSTKDKHPACALETIELLLPQLSAEIKDSEQNSPIAGLFSSSIRYRRQCWFCAADKLEEVQSLHWRIAFPPNCGDSVQLVDCLAHFFEMKDINAFCPGCQGQDMNESKFLVVTPDVLIILLDRRGDGKIQRINTLVNFPDELDISPWRRDSHIQGPVKYHLHSVIQHQDSRAHFIAHVRINDTWFGFDDTQVNAEDAETVHEIEASILFYTNSELPNM
jgi:hypothetical protein